MEKNINQITFDFAEEGPGRGSEDIKKECNVNCFDFFFFSVLFDGRRCWKNHDQLNRTALKQKKEETNARRKRARSALSRERTLELRQ